jgi:hypothetical protein
MIPAHIPEELLIKYNEEEERKRKEFKSAKLWDNSGNWIGTFITVAPVKNFDNLNKDTLELQKNQEKYMNANEFYMSCNKK